jgi:glycosyltransferase involved in cell wall biosynthesis
MSEKIRVLHVITRLEPGGAQRNTLYTAGNLDREVFDVGLAWGPGDHLDRMAHEIGDLERVPIDDLVRQIAPGRDLRAVGDLRRAIRSFSPDIVHTHSSKAGIVGRFAAAVEGVPVIIHSIHGYGFTPLQPLPVRGLFFAAEVLASRWTHHFIAVSRKNLDLGVELGLFARDEVSLIRSGIELGRFLRGGDGAAVRDRLGLPAGVPLVTQIGNFKPQKAPLDFVRVARRVLRSVPDARFVMVGEGRLRLETEELARELGVADSIVFCGWWDDIPGLLDATTVSVLTSRHEGLPRAVVESLAAGVPVVATSVDGTVEVVRHGINGWLAEAGDVDRLAEGVCRVLGDDELRGRMSSSAPNDLDDFDIDLMVHRQEELYRWLTGRRRT